MYILLGGETSGVGQNLVRCGVKVRRGRIWVRGGGWWEFGASSWRSAVTLPWSSGDGNSPCMGGGGQRPSSDSSPSIVIIVASVLHYLDTNSSRVDPPILYIPAYCPEDLDRCLDQQALSGGV